MNDRTVLLAEDDERQALLITRALSQNKSVNQVIGFSNGQEVLNFLFWLSDCNLSGDKYVLLLDIQMLKVGEIEVLKIVKNYESLKLMPVIICSSVKNTQAVELCYCFGCDVFINKPIDCTGLKRLSMLNFLSLVQISDAYKDSFIKSVY